MEKAMVGSRLQLQRITPMLVNVSNAIRRRQRRCRHHPTDTRADYGYSWAIHKHPGLFQGPNQTQRAPLLGGEVDAPPKGTCEVDALLACVRGINDLGSCRWHAESTPPE
jgi:hypothetical protein